MKIAAYSAFAISLAAFALNTAHACSIQYQNTGTVAATSTIKATATGELQGYFVGYSAADTDEIRMVDMTTGYTSAYSFVNKTTVAGKETKFGSVNAGDTLILELYNETTGLQFASNPSLSADGINHAYTASFGGGTLDGVAYAAGDYTYFGMEDLPKSVSDLDYNDDQFLFKDVSANVTPEPNSLLLFGTGLLTLGLMLRRRITC